MIQLKLVKSIPKKNERKIDIDYYKQRLKQENLNDWEKLVAEVALDMIPKLECNVEYESSEICASAWKLIKNGGQQKAGEAFKALVDGGLLPLVRLEKKTNNHQRYMRM